MSGALPSELPGPTSPLPAITCPGDCYCGMYIPLSDDEHQFVQKVHLAHANDHWEHGRNSNPVATLSHATVVLYATICMHFLTLQK